MLTMPVMVVDAANPDPDCMWVAVKYELNGGSDGPDDIPYGGMEFNTHDHWCLFVDDVIIPIPTKDGCTFYGWFDSDGTIIYDSNGQYVHESKDRWNTGYRYIGIPDSDDVITLYAMWESSYSDLEFLSNPITDGVISYTP